MQVQNKHSPAPAAEVGGARGAGPMAGGNAPINEIERRIARWLVERRSVLIPLGDVKYIVRGVFDERGLECGAECMDEIISRLPLYEVYSKDGGDGPLIFLPQGITGGESVERVVAAISLLLRANYWNHGIRAAGGRSLRHGELEVAVANMLYEEFAAWNEFGDGMAWYHAHLTLLYNIYDELIDKFDYKSQYAGPRCYRVGDVWLVARWKFCNKSRRGYDVGIQKCVEYNYERLTL